MLCEKLFKVRSEFVKRVSEEILIQLLDDLETDGVFNLSEKRAILEGNQITANKARETIDAVRMKGQRACEMMIQRLHNIDPTLSKQLALSPAKGENTQFIKATFIAQLLLSLIQI
uniref:CARD domain-containing protein n=1 Tax=Xiphophorus couchianus TaxID=32473 RepID=A0A3B5LIA3_9TELE